MLVKAVCLTNAALAVHSNVANLTNYKYFMNYEIKELANSIAQPKTILL